MRLDKKQCLGLLLDAGFSLWFSRNAVTFRYHMLNTKAKLAMYIAKARYVAKEGYGGYTKINYLRNDISNNFRIYSVRNYSFR